MIRSLLAGLVLLALGAFAHADNFSYIDASGNKIIFPCTTANGVCTPTVSGGGGGGGDVNIDEVAGVAVSGGTAGSLPVSIVSGGGSGGTASDFGSSFPASGTAAGFSDGTNMRAGKIFDLDSGGGTDYIVGMSLRFAASGGSAAAPGDATNGLLVNLGSNNDVTVTGSVTANAGTNLNTSALALESGGNLATTATNTGTTNTNLGAPGATACATDTGSCSVNALLQRIAQRVTSLIASLGGTATTGQAVPSTAVYIAAGSDGGLSAGTAATTGLISCNSSVAISAASSGNNQLVALTSGETVYICGYELVAAGTVDVQFITGTGTACATNEFDETGAMPLVANSGLVSRSPFWTGMAGLAGDAFCIELSASVQVSGVLYYTKF